MTINDIQDEIIADFELLGGDRESMVVYIMELGQKLPQLSVENQIDQNLIKGCQSKVWLTAELDESGKINFLADSNTDVTKGLISLLVRVVNNQTPNDIMNADLYFFEKIGMHNVIGSQRSNGFVAMLKQIKLFAVAFNAKLKA
ncbi:MAG: SufE family protein [Cytophagales bacterium]|nr:SufE family protein [Cytophagales bacterium]